MHTCAHVYEFTGISVPLKRLRLVDLWEPRWLEHIPALGVRVHMAEEGLNWERWIFQACGGFVHMCVFS